MLSCVCMCFVQSPLIKQILLYYFLEPTETQETVKQLQYDGKSYDMNIIFLTFLVASLKQFRSLCWFLAK